MIIVIIIIINNNNNYICLQLLANLLESSTFLTNQRVQSRCANSDFIDSIF